MAFTEEGRAWLAQNYPNLRCILDGELATIEGQFDFIAAYGEQQKRYVINPNSQHETLHIIQDSYQIKITFPSGKPEYPKVWEIGGRLQEVAKKTRKRPEDLHIIPVDGSLCLVGLFDIQLDITLQEYFDGPLLQFFYDQSYFERHGKWVRGEYSHGTLGILENYFDKVQEGFELANECLTILFRYNAIEPLTLIFRGTKVPGHHLCFCKSGKRLRDCHMKVLQGLRHLQSYVSKDPSIRCNEIYKKLLSLGRRT